MDKILLVDDETDIEILAKQKFRKEITSGVFEILFSHNAHDALELLEKEPDIAVVISDLNMPGMDGLTFLDKLKTLNPAIKTIVVSAYGDMKTIRTAMNTGVFDFITKPVDFKDLGDVIIRSLALYHSSHSPLYTYQRMLESSLPNEVELTYNSQEKALLWDAFSLNPSQIDLMGFAILPSPLLSDIAFGAVHGIVKTVLRKGPLSLNEIHEIIYKIIPSLKTTFFIGQYCKVSQEFSYETNGEFMVQHQRSGRRSPLPASQAALLALGDVLILQHPFSPSTLSMTPIHEG
jgi:CheY-like chemotaxis protein